MGTIRLLLALAVVFGHARGFGMITNVPQRGYFPVDPTIAVEMFFVVSGFLMCLILTPTFRNAEGWIRRFYVDRYFFRLMPAYLMVLFVVTCINPILFNLPWTTSSGALLGFSSLTLLGIDLTAFYDVSGVPASGVIPLNQAWSLGVEIAFYVIVPFLVTLRTRTLVLITAALLCARIATIDAPEVIQQRLFPMQFFFFMLGMMSFRIYKILPRNTGFGALALACLVLLVARGGYIGFQGWSPTNAIYATCALALLMPGLFKLTKDWRLDRLLGDLSYPLYLVHIDCGSYIPHARDNLWIFMGVSVAVAIPLLFLVEIPMGWVRHRKRTGIVQGRSHPSITNVQLTPHWPPDAPLSVIEPLKIQ